MNYDLISVNTISSINIDCNSIILQSTVTIFKALYLK